MQPQKLSIKIPIPKTDDFTLHVYECTKEDADKAVTGIFYASCKRLLLKTDII